MVAGANSHCGQRYPVSGQEECNNLIEKIGLCECAICRNKKTKVISPCDFDVLQEEGVG